MEDWWKSFNDAMSAGASRRDAWLEADAAHPKTPSWNECWDASDWRDADWTDADWR